MATGRRIAVLIGNAAFADARLSRLFAPRHDIEALNAVLEDPALGGFDKPVRVLFDEALMTVREAVAEACDAASPGDLFLFYYSGHGVLTAHGDLYFALRDTTVNRPQVGGLEAAWLRDQLDKYCRAQSQVVILDCCHSGAYIPGRKDAAAPAVTAATLGGGHGRYVLTACTAQAFSWDSSVLKEGPEVAVGRTSVFTGLVVAGLKGAAAPDKETITADDLYDYVFRNRPPDGPLMSPQRFVDRGTGELILARSPARLRPDLVAALNHANAYMRLGAVTDLEAMVNAGDGHAAAAARRALAARLDVEEHVRVYKRIEAALGTPTPMDEGPAAAKAEEGLLRAEVEPTNCKTDEAQARPVNPDAQRGCDLHYNLEISLEDAFAGAKRTIQYPVEAKCPACWGSGIFANGRCSVCGGGRRMRSEKTLQVTIPAGIEDATRIRLEGKGEAGLGVGPPGDLYIFVTVAPHQLFRREGANLYLSLPLKTDAAERGATIEVPTIDGKRAKLVIPPGTQTGQVFCLSGKGMSMLNSQERGDLYVVTINEPPRAGAHLIESTGIPNRRGF